MSFLWPLKSMPVGRPTPTDWNVARSCQLLGTLRSPKFNLTLIRRISQNPQAGQAPEKISLVQLSKNQPQISKFEQDIRISKFCTIEISHHPEKRKIDITHLIFKIQVSNFTCKPNYYSQKNPIWHQGQKTKVKS